MSGEGSSSTPPTPSTSTGIPPVSPFLTPTPGIRYPLYAAVQGSPLLYSPAIFSQAMFPWRSLASSGTTVPASTSTQSYQTSASSSSSPQIVAPPTATPTATPFVQSLTALAQLPGLVYPLPAMGMPMLAPQQGAGGSPQSSMSEGRRTAGSETMKRKLENASNVAELDTKRPRLVDGIPHSPSFHPPSSPSPKVVSMATSPAPQRSPVIKFIPYNPGQLGQSMMIPSAIPQATPTATPTTISALPQAVVLPTIPNPNLQQHPPHATHHHHHQHQQQPSQGAAGENPQGAQRVPYKPPAAPHPPLNIRILLLKCFGPVAESVVNQNRLIVSNLLQDLYRPSYFTTSNYSDPPLSPESCALLTICYLNSLLPGELMNTENLRAMMHYAQLGEMEWLHYYKKHKKMSESTFVQSQLMHLSRIAVYPVLGKIRVMISNQSLGEGVSVSLQNLAQLASVSKQSLPEFVVVLAVRPSATIDFCVLVLNPLQVKILQEMQGQTLLNGRTRVRVKAGARLQDDCGNSDSVRLQVDKKLLALVRSFQRKLNGRVLIPFHHPSSVSNSPDRSPGQFFRHSQIPSSVAESLIPTASHVVEHKPRGPFQGQYGIAMYMLQKLMSGWGSQTKISNYQKVEFRVLCPPEESLVGQTIAEISDSGILDYLELGGGGSSSPLAEIEERIIRCSQDDSSRFSSLLDEAEESPDVLYFVVAESAHLTSSIATLGKETPHSPTTPTSDNLRLLCSLPNCLLVSVSSHPYLLQTNRSLISYANEVHWPLRPHLPSPEGSANAVAEGNTLFCSAHNYQAGLWDYGVAFREDSAFEGMFLEATGNLGPSPPDLPILRVQLLLNQYTAALLSGSAHPSSPPALPETQEIVNSLVDGPLSNPRGYGNMVIVRSHDKGMAKQFYHKLRAVRDALGLKYRFEMILDDGSKRLALSEHFTKRVAKWRGSGYHGNLSPGYGMSYRDLENLPCLVVLAGQSRAGLGFPSSLRYVDLRLCYSPLLSRAVYEHDISLLNAYRTLRPKNTPTDLWGCRTAQEEEESMEEGGEESDCEVFEDPPGGAGPEGKPHPLPVQTGSSSSSRKSSYNDEHDDQKEESNHGRTNIVEWKPEPKLRRKARKNMGNENGTVTRNGIQENEIHSPPETVTVTIDPPEDQALEFHSHDSNIPSRQSDSSDDDLAADLDGSESESEGEECESAVHSCVCLLSRPYYHIWSSRSPHQHLLLPPSPGVDWHGGHKRPPLFDPDPHQQSAYYRKWSKPSGREVKNALDSVIKEAGKGSRRRFLLTGPPQVGKTGAWLLLIRLVHDHIRAAQGVVVVNKPTPTSMFLESTPRGPGAGTSRSPRGDPGRSGFLQHSRVISLDHLQRISLEIQEDEKPALIAIQDRTANKTHAEPSPTQATDSTGGVRHTVSLPVSPYIAYDYTHSCTECAKYLRGSPVAKAEILTSLLPTKGGSHVTIHWHVPTYQQKHCVASPDRKTLERLKLQTLRPKSDKSFSRPLTPIFTPTLGRDSSGLFNLFHTSYDFLHVMVTSAGQFERYCKTWPNQLIMAFQDQGSLGLGQTYSLLKQFALYNFQLNETVLQFESPSHTVWPYMVVMSDSCVMCKRLSGEGVRSSDVPLSEVICSLEQTAEQLQCAAVGIPQWNKQLEEGAPSGLSDYDLSHDFILLNLSKTANLHFNSFSYNSATADFNLQLKATALKAKLNTELAFVKKHLTSGGNFYPLHHQLSGLCWDVDMLVISLHHDSSSLLPHPGPYLMEHFLLHRSRVLFPYALQERHPILMVDNYINLGPSIHITFVKSDRLQNWKTTNGDDEGFDDIFFGGLMLYLCEGKITSAQLHKLNFVPGACLCLVTRDCKSLVREVARLDLEEKWKFRLRDEYQTACPDDLRPLFFLTGRFET